MRFLIIIFIISVFSSCTEKHISLKSMEKRLTENEWKMNSYIDYDSNTSLETSKSTYKFLEDGTYRITPEKDSTIYYSDWEFIDNYEYIKIGSNTFKVEILTNKLLGLNYGSVGIYYIINEN